MTRPPVEGGGRSTVRCSAIWNKASLPELRYQQRHVTLERAQADETGLGDGVAPFSRAASKCLDRPVES